MGKIFIDTNILVYTFDRYDAGKQKRCRELMQLVTDNHIGVISTQVMQEFYVAATNKLAADPILIKNILKSFKHLEIVIITPELIDNAIDIQITNKLSFWDSLIIASAEHAKCQQLWTEDLNHGQIIRGVKIINPVRH